jgi:hypothetical protein
MNLKDLFNHENLSSIDSAVPVLVGEEASIIESNGDLELELLAIDIVHDSAGGKEEGQDQFWEA